MKFISVTKPGIIFGNIITLSGGFFLGSQPNINFKYLVLTLLGMSCVIAAGCVLNNFIDRDIDYLMERTKNRVLVRGLISGRIAISYAILLIVLGLLILYYGANLLTAIIACVGLFFYVVVYTLGFKRRSIYGTIIGGIAGATPPVVGYCAVTNKLDIGAALLFFILFLWQIPHFYAISIYRLEDYQFAGIPILPLKKSIYYTKFNICVYILLFTLASILPTLFGYTGIVYLVFAASLGSIWLAMAIYGMFIKNNKPWARKLFIFSIINITLLCMMMMIKQ